MVKNMFTPVSFKLNMWRCTLTGHIALSFLKKMEIRNSLDSIICGSCVEENFSKALEKFRSIHDYMC